MSDFVHLHTHTHMSSLDGLTKIPDLVERTKELGMSAATISDHGVCTGFIQHYKECKKQDIKPILGAELYLSPTDDHTLREPLEGHPKQQCYHLTLLAKNAKGVSQLYELSSRGFMEGFYYKPRVSLPMIEEIGKDLIVMGACAKGPVSWNIRQGNNTAAKKWLGHLKEIFPDRFYLELMDHNLDWQKDLNIALAAYSEAFDVPWIPTNDSHFLKREDHFYHSLLMCIQTKETLESLSMRYPEECYLKSAKEMQSIFGVSACQRTLEIEEQIDINLELGRMFFPEYISNE